MGNPDISKLRIIDVINKDSRGECVSQRACFDPVILQLSSTTEKMAIDFANMIHPDQKIRIGSNVFHWCTRGGENPKIVLTKESHLTTPVDQWHNDYLIINIDSHGNVLSKYRSVSFSYEGLVEINDIAMDPNRMCVGNSFIFNSYRGDSINSSPRPNTIIGRHNTLYLLFCIFDWMFIRLCRSCSFWSVNRWCRFPDKYMFLEGYV